MKTAASFIRTLTVLSLLAFVAPVQAEVILQYFETEWEEIYRRLPEISEIGYSGIWHPSPAKSPVSGGQFAGGGNVGYSLFDRFDIGDVPQRGDRATRYGSRGQLRRMVDNAHQTDIKIYPDIVMNHAGNGPHFWTYPGMKPNDFHGWWNSNEPGGFRRAPRMNNYGEVNNGYGRTFQEELVSLIDIVTERDNRFSTGAPNYATPDEYVRQPGQYDLYPFHGPGDALPNEHPVDFLNRWVNWLGYAMDFDGVRLDAPKHVIADFFGQPGWGFNHEIQFNYKHRRGYDNWTQYGQLYQNELRRRDAPLIFSEFFIGDQSEIDYWRNFGVKMRYLDFPRKSQMVWPAFNNGNLAALSSFAGFSPQEGVMFVQSHDENPPHKLELAYAYILTRVGLPIVYTTGNNLAGGESKVNTWMLVGHEGALGDWGHQAIPNLVYIRNNFARGNEWERWSEGDFYAFERYEDLNSNGSPQAGEGLLLVALNDSGGNQTRTLQTAFQPFTVLHDYTGNAGPVTVNAGGQAEITVPGMGGQGFVAYAPKNVDGPAAGEPIRFRQGGNPVGEIDWVVPGGRLAADKPRTIPRVTGDTVDIDIHFDTGGPAADNVMIKWGEGDRPANTDTTTYYYDGGYGIVSGGFQNSQQIAPGHWRLTADTTRFPEGLHVIRARVFNQRDPGLPALYQTFSKVFYLDRRGPDIEFANLDAGQTVRGAPMIEIANPDRLAAMVEYSTDGSTFHPADKVMAGFWQFALPVLPAGAQTLTIRAREYDWDEPRKQINETIATRNFTVDASGPAIAIEFDHHVRPADAASGEIHMPFFTVKVVTEAGKPASQVRLFWNEYEMVGLNGTGEISTTFDGRYKVGNVTNRLWGSFVNGAHVFEAMVEHNGQWYRASRRAVFNLYGQNLIDSDGDGLPDNVEMPFFDTGTAPGYGQKWPGDNNEDMIPNDGENWTRLNPMNHDTTYSGTWDGDEDWSGDGYSNLYKVRRGYWDHGNAYHYGIYANHAGQLGDEGDWDWGGGGNGGGGGLPGLASWNPPNPDRCPASTLTITYDPREGTLESVSPIHIHLGFNGWQDVVHPVMTDLGNGTWQYMVDPIPEGTYQISFVFRDAAGTAWDNNNNNDWHVSVAPCGGAPGFIMDAMLDSEAYEIANHSGMKIWAAVRDTKLYVATWGTGPHSGIENDHFIMLSDRLGDAAPSPWEKLGVVFLGDNFRYLGGEGGNEWNGWFNLSGTGDSANSNLNPTFNYLEGVIDLVEEFGGIPEAIYIAVGVYGNFDGDGLIVQVPAPWDHNNNIEVTEFLRVPIASIRDQNGDGHFDGGNPLMWTVVNGDTNNANYGLRRFFLDEVAGDQEHLTVIVEPRAGGTNQITEIEVFSNLNRRDFAVLPGDENPDDVTATSLDTYYRGWPMESIGGGRWSATLPVNKCGAYRINARWRINGGPWKYYTDGGLRRDTAVVVSPKKALDTVLYELNPLTAESTTHEFGGRSTFRNMYTSEGGRPNAISPAQLQDLGVNMIWLQPIHPIGTIGRQTDPLTGQPYDPGSPYAVRNYWEVNSVLGDPATRPQAMTEFTNFVAAYNAAGIGIMLDGTFNHSAWDCEIGVMATQMGLVNSHGNPLNPDSLISAVRPGWYSKKDSYGEPATYFVSMENNDIAVAPDRIDFGKWSDAADFFFGRYDALVQYPAADPENAWNSSWFQRYLREDDRLQPLGSQTRELWDYFANYSLYWLEKTGLPAGRPVDQQDTGIAGLRCDFAQGLPNEFWEYTINRTRSVKWDFLFMAESLDGYRVVDGSSRHGVGYRSARHFDILNENIVFMWRDNFFSYRIYEGTGGTPNKSTGLIWNAFDSRKNAFEMSPILLNLTSHDEIFPTDDQYGLLFAYAINAAMDGVPMIFYGQEMGAQNYFGEYGPRTDSPDGISPLNNFSLYEQNFGKFIPNFKRYNHMTNVWNAAGWKDNIRGIYSRLNKARQNSPALRSQQNYFLDDFNVGGWNNDIFAVAKFQQPGISAAEQDVVFVFVNNDFRGNPNRAGLFDVSATVPGGANWFGIQPGHNYNVVNLVATNPTALLWGAGIMGSDLIANGIYVGFHEDETWVSGGQAQYIRLLDITAGMTATSVNDYVPPRYAAPVIQAIGNQSVEAGDTLSFNVNVTTAPGDSVTLTAQSDLAPVNWSFTAPNVFSFTPVIGEVGVHTFLFTATGLDGYDEEWIIVTVTSDSPPPTPYQTWLGTYGIDPQAPLAGPNDDFDGDGYTNEEEFWADTHPNNADSFPSVSDFRKDSQGRWRIEMQKGSAATRSYTVHRAAELEGDGWEWTPHVTIPRTDGVLTVDPVAPPMLIFKVTIEPPTP